MRPKPSSVKKPAEQVVKDIRRQTRRHFSAEDKIRIARLAYLAPDITSALLDGKHPPAMTSRTLLMTPDLPLDWNQQRQLLGFAATAA